MEFFELWKDGLKMEISDDAMPIGTDSVLLAHFADIRGRLRGLDLGCGSGLLALTLALRSKAMTLDGIELSPAAAELARRNAALNGLSDRVNIITGDLRLLRETDVGKRYDFIISNPPYFSESSGTVSDNAARAARRSETTCSLSELVSAVSRLLKFGGRFFMVYPIERLAEAICALSAADLQPKRMRLVQANVNSVPSLALIECRLGGKPGLKAEPVLVLYEPDGMESAEFKKIYFKDEETSDDR